MKNYQLGKFFLFGLVGLFSFATLAYYLWFFDDFMTVSAFKGITLLITFIFTSLFFAIYTVDFLKNDDQ